MISKSLAAFWKDHHNGRIETAVINCKDGEVIVRAEIFAGREDARPIATGHSYERDEMSAVDKALEIAGYHGGEGGAVEDSAQGYPLKDDPGEFEVK